MASFEYNPIAESLTLTIRCKCGNEVTTDAFNIPLPNFSGDNHADSCNDDEYEYNCEECEELYQVVLTSSISGGFGDISELEQEDLLNVEENYSNEENEYYENMFLSMQEEKGNYFSLFNTSMDQIQEALSGIQSLNAPIQEIMRRLLYANVIGSMEAYLSDTFIQKVLSAPETKRKFTEKFKDFKEEKFSLSDLFKKLDEHDKQISKALRDIIYHNLPKVKGMYKDTFDVEFGDIKDMMKAVSIRHDIVHRNGKDKEGNMKVVTESEVQELISKAKTFIENIEKQISTYFLEEDLEFGPSGL